MTGAFAIIWVSGIIIGICILLCILYSAYKITEAKGRSTLMEAEFPISTDRITKKNVYEYEDFYSWPSSDARVAIGAFYSDANVESLRKKNSPQKLLKGRS